VKKEVEVIELKNKVQEIETMEPQKFTKQVEVTEFVPSLKQVEVTQPVTVKKAVEFVEPVITTQTITKELQQPVVVDEKVTTTVGPASVVGEIRETAYSTVGNVRISEQERINSGYIRARVSEQERGRTKNVRKGVDLGTGVSKEMYTKTAKTEKVGNEVIKEESERYVNSSV